MQSTLVQMKTRTTQATNRESLRTVKNNACNAELVDPFLQMIMSLLPQQQDPSTMQQDGAVGNFESAQPIDIGTLLQSEPDGSAVQQNVLLSGNLNAATLMNMQAAAGAVVVPDGIGTNEGTPVLYEKTLDSATMFAKNTDNAGTIAISTDALTQMTNLLGLSDKNQIQSVFKNTGIEVSFDGLDSTQSGQSDAIVKAKQLLSADIWQQTQEQKDTEIDIDKLQNELAKADTLAPFELRFKAIGQASEATVLDQMTEEIKQNFSLGKSEFIIKLKPEALGEITVKLIEEAGKTTLTITTAKAQTAKLINEDINALRDAVAPMKVEVRNAVVSTSETASGTMQQFNMTGQQAGQEFAGQQGFYQMSRAAQGQTDSLTVDDTYEPLQAAQLKNVLGDRLDAYI